MARQLQYVLGHPILIIFDINVRPIRTIAEAGEFRPEEIFFFHHGPQGRYPIRKRRVSRISGHSKAELYCDPHTIIRHPDMPRAAFYLLWAKLKQGLPFAGYVKNMAKDGRYYRVFVLAVSAGPHRYLSVRFKPTTALRGTHALRDQIGAITQCTEVINTRISMAHLQMEMLRFFQKEAAARQTPPWPGSGKSSPR